MLATMLRGGAQLLLNFAVLSEESLSERYKNEKAFQDAVIHDLTTLAEKESSNMQINQSDVDNIKAQQLQLATDLANDGTIFQKGLHDLKDAFQAQLDAAAAGNVPVNLADINSTFASLHTTAGTLIDFGTQSGGTVTIPPAVPAPPTPITDPPVVVPPVVAAPTV